jgi:hypothetical protein
LAELNHLATAIDDINCVHSNIDSFLDFDPWFSFIDIFDFKKGDKK